MNIHVITPFFRIQNKDRLIAYLDRENVIWHPVLCPATDGDVEFPKQWIDPCLIPSIPADWHISSYKSRYFIEHHAIVPDDYYCFMCDDDSYEAGFFNKIRTCSENVIVVSMMRGDNRMDSTGIPHDITTLIASPQNMKRGHVSSQQYIVKGKVLRTFDVQNTGWSDGLLAEYLGDNFTIRYEPEWYALFNYLQPGRWNCANGILPNRSA